MKWALGVVACLFSGAMALWLKFINADRQGLAPTDHLAEMRREDGGLGPIAKEDLAELNRRNP